jgi:hypothetical protein
MGICDHALQTLPGSILSFQASIVSIYGPPRLYFEPRKLLDFKKKPSDHFLLLHVDSGLNTLLPCLGLSARALFFTHAIYPKLFCAAMPKSKSEHFDLSSKTKPTNKPRKSPLREKSKSSERDFRRGKSKSPRNSRIIPGKFISPDRYKTTDQYKKQEESILPLFYTNGKSFVLFYFDQCFGSLTF